MEATERLQAILAGYGKVAVAFSGGVDSALLAQAARRALGDDAVAVTAWSELLGEAELAEAKSLARWIGIRHVTLHAADLENRALIANDKERCYYCKKARFERFVAWAAERGILWVAEGSNLDDRGDYRPGMRAVAELPQVVSPLVAAGLDKAAIRRLARAWGLPVWNKPSAACLASRLCYGLEITAERLRQVELAEAAVRRLAAGQVRVRHHGDLARIEVEDPALLAEPAARTALARELKALGFTFVTLDLAGYRMGSNNEAL